MKTKCVPMSGDRTEVTFAAYNTKDAHGNKVTVPAYTNVVRNVNLKDYVIRIEAERAAKPPLWSPS